MNVSAILKSPLYVASLVTGAKSFLNNPVIGSRRLNERGLHRERFKTADRMARFRRRSLDARVDPDHIAAFERDGFVAVENALSDDEFEALKHALETRPLKAYEFRQGRAVTRFAPLTPNNTAFCGALNGFVYGDLFQGLLRYVASCDVEPVTYVHSVFADLDQPAKDPQTVLHSDTFHATAKGWLFLHDVGEEEGPFTYVPGSHRMTPERLQWEYEQSLTARASPNGHHALGSLRIADSELERLNLPPRNRISVRANTLVIADTHGFHARDVSRKPTSRFAIYGSVRRNPFLPWSGLDIFGLPGLRGQKTEIFHSLNAMLDRHGIKANAHTDVGPKRLYDPPAL